MFGLALILRDRTQITVIDQRSSNKAVVTYVVPQGSVLGPLLLLLYINDIYSSSNKLKFYLFADDTNILYSHKNLKSFQNVMNFELNNVFQWLTSNKLTLNQILLSFARIRNVFPLPRRFVSLNSKQTRCVRSQRLLTVLLCVPSFKVYI